MNFEQLYNDVIKSGLCTRCGICSGICPAGVIHPDRDAYPLLTGKCVSCGFCTKCCPGYEVNFKALSKRLFGVEYDAEDLQGYVENMFVAHANDTKVRDSGASGGLVTSLLIYLLESGKIDGALVVSMDKDEPYRTKGILATTPQEILEAAKSKYCITPSMDVLKQLRKMKGKFAVVALPCQIHGLRKLEEVDQSLSEKIFCILGLFCNCNLNLNGHSEAIETCGIKLDEVTRFDFRGGGWPGGFYVEKNNGAKIQLHSINIRNVMNVMFRLYGALRCYICVDALAEYADLSFGDFWSTDYIEELSKLEGCTLVYQRTSRGLNILREATEYGAISMHDLPKERASKRILNMSSGKKQRAWVRLRRKSIKHQPVPRYHFDIPKYTSSAVLADFMYRMFGLFRGPKGRKFILKILFSSMGAKLDRINNIRKNIFCKYHNN